MSGIAGRIDLRGRKLDQEMLGRMAALIAYRGPDGKSTWVNGSVSICHRHFHTTPESIHERQPQMDPTGQVCLVLDGRIDNREELKTALEPDGARLRSPSDAELVLRAYLRWGDDFAVRILGDYALAIWDARNRRLLLARDILGLKPLYYYVDAEKILWCSEIRPLFADPSVPKEPNEGMVGEFLADSITSLSETLYQGVFRVLPAHIVVFDIDRPELGPRMKRYWPHHLPATVGCGTDGEYAERLREILQEAVRCRLRSLGPVGIELSGGLDSSFVACLASDAIRQGSVAVGGVEAFSLVFPGSSCDESCFLDAVVARCGMPSNRICPPPQDLSWHRAQVVRDWLPPDYPNGSMARPLRACAVDKGFRVLLTGLGGDEWFQGSRHYYADLLRTCRIASLLRRARADPAVPTLLPWPSNPLLVWAIGPLLPHPLKRIIRAVQGQRRTPAWLPAPFARRIALRDRQDAGGSVGRFSSCAQADQFRLLCSGIYQWQIESIDRSASAAGIELRHPFHDRRIIEFSLALPEEQKWRAGLARFVLREAMRGIVPEMIRQRIGKAEFSEIVVGALRAAGGKPFFDSLTIATVGWVDPVQVARMYQDTVRRAADRTGPFFANLWPLWRILATELWFDVVFGDNRSRV